MIRFLLFSSAALITGSLFAQGSSDVIPVPASIWEIQVESVEAVYGPGPGRAMIPTRHFHLKCTIAPLDSTFWRYGSFRIIYTLPAGDTQEHEVKIPDQQPADGGFVVIELDIMSNRDGWADFTLTPNNSAHHADVHSYEIHSNFKGVLLPSDK
jgi:hypothetical protein